MTAVNKRAVAAAFGRAAGHYAQHDELQRLSASLLLEQLDIKTFPEVLDAGCGPGSISRFWRDAGSRVTALDRHGEGGLCGDLADLDGLAATVRALKPQVIVNAAAHTAVDRAESEPELAARINAQAPAVLAREAAAVGALLVHYSTDYVFDGSGQTPWQGTTPPAHSASMAAPSWRASRPSSHRAART